MKKLFLLLVGCIFSILPMLGQVAVATLSHDSSITSFYGNTALKNAYNAAQDGDVITLSPGVFTATDLDKSIIIRGAGMDDDATKNRQRTVLNGNFKISNTTEGSREITIEGIYHYDKIEYGKSIDNMQFIKCRLKTFSFYNETESSGSFTFMNCKVASELIGLGPKTSIFCINCVVNNPRSYSNNTNFYYENCVIIQNPSVLYLSTLKNCIFYSTSNGGILNTSNIANNCVGTGNTDSMWRNLTMTSNSVAQNIFKTFNGTYSDSETFELTDGAKTKYLGSDGKEVGIYGGTMSFDPLPTNPQITKFEVAPKSTPEGKLSIDIKVE